jgi:hypothetical protein
MHIQAQLQDPIAIVGHARLIATTARYSFVRFIIVHRADNLQRVLFVVGSCHLVSALTELSLFQIGTVTDPTGPGTGRH